MLNNYKIAVIEGDGIGHEVVPEGLRVLEAAGRRHNINFSWQHFNWSCQTYLKTGRMMPEDGLEQLRSFDAIYLGAIGYPGVPDHISLWGLLIPIRRAFQRYVGLRPVRLLPGIDSALKNFPPGQIDMCIVRENVASPIAQIWSGAVMFEHPGQRKAARGDEKAFEAVLERGDAQTPDLGGKASTG